MLVDHVICDVPGVHFLTHQSASRSGGKVVLYGGSGLTIATVRGNDCHGEGWYH
jgi:hypothetical protein